jgi:hypothetical protein
MNTIRELFQAHRPILGLAAGVAVAVLGLALTQRAVVVVVLGTMIALLIAHPRQSRDYFRLGFATGVIVGPLAGVRAYPGTAAPPVHASLPLVLLSIFWGVLWCAVLCAAYGLVCGKLYNLYPRHGSGSLP